MAATVRRLCTVAGEGWVVVGVGVGVVWGGLDFVMLFRVTPVAGSCLALSLHRRPLRQQPCCNRQPPASMAPSCTTSNCLCACIGFCSITARIPLSGFLLRCKHLSSRRQSRRVNLATTATTRLVDDASPLVLVKALAISRAKDEFHFAVSNISEFLELKQWHLCC